MVSFDPIKYPQLIPEEPFSDYGVAQRFFTEYRLLKLDDFEFPFEVVNVYKKHEKQQSNALALQL